MTPPHQTRVLVFGSALGGGGAETRFRLLFESLFGGAADGVALHETPSPTLRDGQRFFSLGWQRKSDYLTAALRLRRILSKGSYDAVLSLGLYPNVVLSLACLGLRRRPALVMTEITRPYTESTRFSNPLAARIRPILYRLSYRAADRVAANSEDGRHEVVHFLGVASERAVRVPNLIETERVRDRASQAHNWTTCAHATHFCMVARFDPMKRVDTLLRAAHALQKPEWHVDLVGDGPERPAVEALIAELRIADKVTLHGWVANPHPLVAAAGASVLCSEYEGFSNSVLEAMVIGTPVLTSFCSRDARDMHDKGAALGFEVGDWQTLSLHMARIMSDTDLRTDLRRAAQAYAGRHHLTHAVEEYQALLMAACKNRAEG